MAAARFSSDVLQTFYSPIAREQNRNLPQPLRPESVPVRDVFKISQSNFQEWLRVWIMNVSKTNPNNKDIFMFKRENYGSAFFFSSTNFSTTNFRTNTVLGWLQIFGCRKYTQLDNRYKQQKAWFCKKN